MSLRLFDGHCDTAFELWRRGESLRHNSCHIDLQRTDDFSVYAQVFAFCSLAGEAENCGQMLRQPLALLREEFAKNTGRIGIARSAREVSALTDSGKIAALLSMEGAECIACDLHRLPDLSEQGFSSLTLTWNAENLLAGCHGSEQGLTPAGREFVCLSQELGLHIDVSHLGEAAFWDLLRMTKAPIYASHSNCAALCPNTRNLTDLQLRAIAETGGTVGLNFYTPFVGGTADFSALRAHLEHMLRLCGENGIALGGDLDGCTDLVGGITSVADYPSFYEYLKQGGFSEALLEKLFFANLLRLFGKE